MITMATRIHYLRLLWAFVYMLMFYGILFSSTVAHEQVHKQISVYYGCVNSTIDINLFKGSYFKCHERYHKSVSDEFFLHAQNEIVSYNLDALLYLIFISVMFFYLDPIKLINNLDRFR